MALYKKVMTVKINCHNAECRHAEGNCVVFLLY